jgi:hypothetical protein
MGVEAGLQFAYDESPEGRKAWSDSLEAAEDAAYKAELEALEAEDEL